MDSPLFEASLEKIRKMDPYSEDPLWVEKNGSDDALKSEDEDDVEDKEAETTDECTCLNCPSREELGGKIVCCMTLEGWQQKFISKDVDCLLDLENFKNICNQDCHEVIRNMMSDVIRDDNPEWSMNRRMRYAGYRSAIYFLYGKLGRRNRIQLPSCVELKMRELYPNEPGVPYVGFKATLFDKSE